GGQAGAGGAAPWSSGGGGGPDSQPPPGVITKEMDEEMRRRMIALGIPIGVVVAAPLAPLAEGAIAGALAKRVWLGLALAAATQIQSSDDVAGHFDAVSIAMFAEGGTGRWTAAEAEAGLGSASRARLAPYQEGYFDDITKTGETNKWGEVTI